MALAGEAGELLAEFQWLTPEQSAQVMSGQAKAQRVRHEMADVFSYLLRLAGVLGVEMAAAVREKVAVNEQHYPERLANGVASKYVELDRPE